jgi:hypothetical protein
LSCYGTFLTIFAIVEANRGKAYMLLTARRVTINRANHETATRPVSTHRNFFFVTALASARTTTSKKPARFTKVAISLLRSGIQNDIDEDR